MYVFNVCSICVIFSFFSLGAVTHCSLLGAVTHCFFFLFPWGAVTHCSYFFFLFLFFFFDGLISRVLPCVPQSLLFPMLMKSTQEDVMTAIDRCSLHRRGKPPPCCSGDAQLGAHPSPPQLMHWPSRSNLHIEWQYSPFHSKVLPFSQIDGQLIVLLEFKIVP